MKTIEKQLCPLCKTNEAEYVTKISSQLNLVAKHFNCEDCTEFVVSTDAEEELKTMVFDEHLKEFSESAKRAALKDHILFIEMRPGPDSGVCSTQVLRSLLGEKGLL